MDVTAEPPARHVVADWVGRWWTKAEGDDQWQLSMAGDRLDWADLLQEQGPLTYVEQPGVDVPELTP